MQEKLSEVVILKMPPSLIEQLRAVAQAEDRTQSSIIRNAVREFLFKNNKPVSISNLAEREDNGFAVGVPLVANQKGEPL